MKKFFIWIEVLAYGSFLAFFGVDPEHLVFVVIVYLLIEILNEVRYKENAETAE